MRRTLSLFGLTVVLAVLVVILPGLSAEGAKKPPPPPPATANPVIAYTTSGGDLMVMDVDGKNQTVLLSGAGKNGHRCYDPSWDPTGDWIVFSDDYPEYGIYMIKKDGTGLCQVVATNDLSFVHPQWNEACGYIVYSASAGDGLPRDLYMVEPVADAGPPMNITGTSDKDEMWPTWSPDGTQIAAQVYDALDPVADPHPDVVVFDVVQGTDGTWSAVESMNLTDSGTLTDYDCTDMDWSNGGDRIAVRAHTPDHVYSYECDIWLIDLDDPDNPTNLTLTSTVWDGNASWSPDDSQIVFCSGGSIYVMNTDGLSDPVRLAAPPRSNVSLREPDWRHN